jgi:hypothetical protein
MATNLDAALAWTTTPDDGLSDGVGPFVVANSILDERFARTQRRWSTRQSGPLPFTSVTGPLPSPR